MSLSAEQFKSIIQGLKSDRPGSGAFEKRASPRVGLRAKITVYPGGDTTKPREVWVRDGHDITDDFKRYAAPLVGPMPRVGSFDEIYPPRKR